MPQHCILLTGDTTKDQLEEMEYMDFLNDTRQQIPSLSKLSSRLKIKLVQDPLAVDGEGYPLEEKKVLR